MKTTVKLWHMLSDSNQAGIKPHVCSTFEVDSGSIADTLIAAADILSPAGMPEDIPTRH